ncbi:uncharacterized protein N7446_005222 [Penicillium canescens]|uniref:Glycoside hydrolase family 71 protein n=1 Tax=Penicillium canescens TaxID=5083 RepID=A0AAD6I9I4_PENCN|nr:uncharacterized protein N7446_005222 [Penicillium canescens]KAJ6038422.1 hypothetical protein N7460_008193 [Penicillium canescens]KAJ6068185.1 hypothetical protein N7446_005222 [Penicillium canescens]
MFRFIFLAVIGLLPFITASPTSVEFMNVTSIGGTNSNTGDRLVFCHFMIGVVSNRQSASDYDADMRRAKEAGIDAFALNIGNDLYTDTQLKFAYQSAADHNMKVFISFDFNWYNVNQSSEIGAKIRQFSDHSAQLRVDGKVFVSSFSGDGIYCSEMRSAAGGDIFLAPNYHLGQGNFNDVDGALNWMAWESDGYNRAPTAERKVSVIEGDTAYKVALGGKPYIAPVSPWFSTHFGDGVYYNKNRVFPSNLLWYDRWREILTTKPRFVEIITWNDYGESHYIGPLSSPHTDDGSSKWVTDMPHNGWLDMAKPFISAYKASSTLPSNYLEEEKLIYWYRPTPKSTDCDATDTTIRSADNGGDSFVATCGRPDGADTMQDSVFVVTQLKQPALVAVTSGMNIQTFYAPRGIRAWTVPMSVGAQSFHVERDGKMVDELSGTSLRDIVDGCICGIYNFNAYVGTLPADAEVDRLAPDGRALLEQGLRVPCPLIH